MPPKRKNGTDGEPTSREKKKQKVATARTIAVQQVKAVSFSETAVAGPSNKLGVDSLRRLPSAIDVERFAEARAFEIDAMQSAMKNASASSTTRAWQALPRHLRRRAASHDVRRVPLRLREKARAEMDPVRKKALGRSVPKLGKAKRLKRTEIFLKRQRDKLWLETHIWHAKRMKMENMWGYRLAVHPTEKSFRPSHRASVHGSIIHDASYFSLIELKGPEKILKTILESCCDPQGLGPGSKRSTVGSRSLETHVYTPGSYPFDFISPATIIWKPVDSPLPDTNESSTAEEQQETADPPTQQNAPKRKRKGKGKEQDKAGTTTPARTDPEAPRVVWVRSHPATFGEVFASLQTAASIALADARKAGIADDKEYEIEIADLRRQVNAFEIMGPKSNQVLRGALSPVPQDQRKEFTKFWSELTNLQSSGERGRGMIVGFKVNDPRLKFPPSNAKAKPQTSDYITAPTTLPSPQLAQSEIWDEVTRRALAKPRYKKKDLDERRSKLLIPGTPLNALRQDDRIPVLLIQRSVENTGSDSQALHGWTLIVPAGWSMAFFSSLTFTGTRVGGQRERQTQAFEAGTAYFPRDFPSSAGYETYATERELEDKARWDRKPPAKRPNFEKLGTRSPWRADWEVVLGLPNRPHQAPALAGDDAQEEDAGLVTTQREEPVLVEDSGKKFIEPWLLRGIEVPNILANMSKLFNPGAGLLQEINKLRSKRGFEPLDSSLKSDDLIKAALVLVRVKMCKRGAPDDLAIIYSIEDEEAKKWERAMRNSRASKADLDSESPEELQLAELVAEASSVIGYVTTGHFSLSQGKGSGIGAIPVLQLLALQEQSLRLCLNTTSKKRPLLVKVRNRNGQQCHAAYVEVLEG
ncbi:Ribonucleases P/MRP protein subunit POP1 [Hypsizygus marmoreus]|uniref:Ribonucleases P/MRP protein subunit POP1 n=1 Tax=Hypsizygus marmoreus TaxID=39966 RepID=A0A369J9D2_HYPMA|nr:Ribonucleases P/MRP protein subunit POP1 [Hypsizygus marmoreus]